MKVSNAISIRVSKIIQKKKFVKDILQSIEKISGKVLLVGGAVRDLFLNQPIKDLDFEVYGLTAEQLEKVLQQYGIVSLVGKSFGVFKLHGLDIDWSLPRQDSSGRHPVVQYDPYMRYEQAFARRDLTINAMGIDMQTFDLIDPFGGVDDLESKILRSPNLEFFVQDPLRLLRVMQFSGRFEMEVDASLSQVCATIDMSRISQERIEQEFRKLFLQAKKPSVGLAWLLRIRKLNEFLPGIENFQRLCEKLDCAAGEMYQTDEEKIVIMWAIVLACVQLPQISNEFEQVSAAEKQPYTIFMRRINHHESMIKKIVSFVVYAQKFQKSCTDLQIKWLAVWLVQDVSIRTLSKFIVIFYGQLGNLLLQRAENLGVADEPELPLLTGKDFLDVAQGVQLGLLVKKAYELQINRAIHDKESLKKFVLKNQD